MMSAHPQPEPQARPAVPLPSAFNERMVIGKPVDTRSPQPEVCDWTLAVPTPDAFNLNVTYDVPKPHPVNAVSDMAHLPCKSAIVIAGCAPLPPAGPKNVVFADAARGALLPMIAATPTRAINASRGN